MSNEELKIHCTKAYEKYKNEFTQHQFSNLSLHTYAKLANPSWQLHRTGRITASICKEVFCTDHTEITNKTLFEKVMQYTKRKPTKQMQYGSAMESGTRDRYFATQKQHVNLSVRETDFHVRVDYPFLWALLDGIVSCDCHDQKLLEIKCPSKYEDGFLNWENDKDFPLAKDHLLKTLHQYYFQVQSQMFICKFSSVDFLLYSPKNNGTVLLTTVKSNKDFIEKMNAKSWQYFENVLLSELVTHRLDNSLENNRKINCFCGKPSFGNMIACDNTKCKFEWFHYFRINITRAVKGKWYCKDCKEGKNKKQT